MGILSNRFHLLLKFLNIHTTSGGIGMSEKQAGECVTVADNYAEEFGRWLRENDNDESIIMSELLQIFYNEKKL